MSDVDTIEDAEIIEETSSVPAVTTTSPSPAHNGASTAPIGLFGTSDPVEVIAHARRAATALMEIVKEQELFLEKPDGKRYLNVEAWTLLAAMLQVRAIPLHTKKEPDADGNWRPPKVKAETRRLHSKWCKQGKSGHAQHEGCDTYEKEVRVVEEEGHGGYSARVEARDPAGNVIGAADSQCMWEEFRWRDSDAYALQSMAQTRGISKALSGPLRFIVELAGFKGTPAEEMDGFDNGTGEPPGEAVDDRNLRCPSCDSGVYDNTTDAEKMEKRWPAYKCKNKRCEGGENGQPWATWDRYFFTDPIVRAKQRLVSLIAGKTAAWRLYYDPTDPVLEPQAEILTQIHADGDPAQMAGFMWTEIVETRGLNMEDVHPDGITPELAGRIYETAALILGKIEEDANDVITLDEAWETVEAKADEDEADPSVGY